MNITVDASSKYQDSLPISSDTIIEMLDNLGITYTRSDHVPLRTLGKFKGIFWSAENKQMSVMKNGHMYVGGRTFPNY